MLVAVVRVVRVVWVVRVIWLVRVVRQIFDWFSSKVMACMVRLVRVVRLACEV